MKILFISQYYPPEIGAASNRIGYNAKYLAQAGHEVSVLTSAPNYPEGKLYKGYANKYTVQNENGVTVYRTRILLSPKTNAMSRLAHYMSFIITSFVAAKRISKPDIIIATSPPLFVGMLGVLFKKLWKIPFILDIRDLWPESVESVGVVKNRRLLKQGERLAHWIYKNADHITATSPGIQKNLPLAAAKKVTIIPNGAELDLFKPDTDGNHMRKTWNLNNKFIVLYTGNLGLAQAPEIFVKTAEILKNEHDIAFLIVGTGVLKPKLQEEANKKNLTNLIFTDSQPRSKMPAFVAAANVCVIPYKAANTFRNTLPSKMFDYMAGGKPIIINLEGEASQLIEKAGCGNLAKEEDPKSLAEKILYLKQNPAVSEAMGKSGRDFVEKDYRREVIATNLEKLILNLGKTR